MSFTFLNQTQVLVNRSVPRKRCERGHRNEVRWPIESIDYGPGECCGIAYRYQNPEPSILKDFSGTTRTVGGYDASPGGKRLDQNGRQTLPYGGEHEQCRSCHVRRGVRPEAEKRHFADDAELSGKRF